MADKKHIVATLDDWKFYDKLAKAMTKVSPSRVYIKDAVRQAMQEYAKNHKELQIKVK